MWPGFDGFMLYRANGRGRSVETGHRRDVGAAAQIDRDGASGCFARHGVPVRSPARPSLGALAPLCSASGFAHHGNRWIHGTLAPTAATGTARAPHALPGHTTFAHRLRIRDE